MTTLSKFTAACALSLSVASAPAFAQLLNAEFAGHYDDSGYHEVGYQGYATGWLDGVFEYRSFFVFDRSSVGGTISGATLQLWNPWFQDYPESGFNSVNLSETLSLYDVTTDLNALLNNTTDAFADLGSGSLFGSVSVSDADDGQWISVSLNSDFLALLNSIDGRFAIGASISSLEYSSGFEALFIGSDGGAELSARLDLTAVPEPSTYGLLGAVALLGAAWFRRRSRTVQSA